MLKVSILDASIYGPNASVDPGLMWWKPQPQAVPPHAKLQQDLGPNKVLIYVYKDVLNTYRSSRGLPPSNQPVP